MANSAAVKKTTNPVGVLQNRMRSGALARRFGSAGILDCFTSDREPAEADRLDDRACEPQEQANDHDAAH